MFVNLLGEAIKSHPNMVGLGPGFCSGSLCQIQRHAVGRIPQTQALAQCVDHPPLVLADRKGFAVGFSAGRGWDPPSPP